MMRRSDIVRVTLYRMGSEFFSHLLEVDGDSRQFSVRRYSWGYSVDLEDLADSRIDGRSVEHLKLAVLRHVAPTPKMRDRFGDDWELLEETAGRAFLSLDEYAWLEDATKLFDFPALNIKGMDALFHTNFERVEGFAELDGQALRLWVYDDLSGVLRPSDDLCPAIVCSAGAIADDALGEASRSVEGFVDPRRAFSVRAMLARNSQGRPIGLLPLDSLSESGHIVAPVDFDADDLRKGLLHAATLRSQQFRRELQEVLSG